MSRVSLSSSTEAFGEAIDKLGFRPPTPVQSLHSIAHLFGTSRNRCGIYLLVFDTCFYIGQAKEVVRRFSQHRRVHNDILAFSFLPTALDELDEAEQHSIFLAEQLGIPLSNAVHVTTVAGEADFDLIVSRPDQTQWYESLERPQVIDDSSRICLPDAHLFRSAKQYARFRKQPLHNDVERLLRCYVFNCLPYPALTEFSFWSVSCMPSTNSSTWPRLICVNLAVMETFVVGFHKGAPDNAWAFINVASDVLDADWRSLVEFESAYPLAEAIESPYRDAGQHQWNIWTDDIDTLEQLLHDRRIIRAASALALRLMRKRATIFSKFHCKQLADEIFKVR